MSRAYSIRVTKSGVNIATPLFSLLRLFVTIMRTTLCYLYVAVSYSIYKAVAVVYPAAPKAAQIAFQRFRLSDSRISVSVDVLQK